MSDLQLSLVALGVVLVAAVAGYNVLVERRARRRAEDAFRATHPDALLDASAPRRDPVMGALPEEGRREPSLGAVDAALGPGGEPDGAGEVIAVDGSATVLASRIDTIALVLADQPVSRAELEPLLDALQSHATPVHVEGLVDEQWVPVELSPRPSWREMRAGLQLASRAGPVSEEEIASFNETVAGFAASINAVSQRESPPAAAARARELDRFCAEADIEVVVNVLGRAGTTFALARVKALAFEQGFAETASGSFERRGTDGRGAIALRPLDGEARRDSSYTTGLTFAIDVPHVADPDRVLEDMGAVAGAFAQALGGELVDDARRPLGTGGLAAIRRSLEAVAKRMQAQGIPAGGTLARRLFS